MITKKLDRIFREIFSEAQEKRKKEEINSFIDKIKRLRAGGLYMTQLPLSEM